MIFLAQNGLQSDSALTELKLEFKRSPTHYYGFHGHLLFSE